MQSLLLPAPWFSKTHFGPHRFDIDPGRVSAHLRPPPSSTGSKASLRASYSAFPMSGIVPTGTQAPQSADTHTATTQREQQEAGKNAENPSSADPTTRSNLPPRLPTLIPVEGPGSVTTQQTPSRFLSTEELLVNTTTQVPSISSTVTLSQVISGSPQLGLHGVPTSSAIRALPPRSTRRAKAHVASACVNCKRKHLGCDSARPCRRCVLSGKASTCVDVTHKKRGRPPLKAEETSLRGVPSLESSVTPREQYQTGGHARVPSHSKTSSREIRPVTDLQYSRPLEHGSAGFGSSTSPLAASSGRWQPFTPPQMISTGHNQRPVSSSSGPPPMSAVNYGHNNPFTSYHMTAFPPPTGASNMPTVVNYNDRPPTTTPPTVSPQQYQQHFPSTLQSHISPQTPSRGLDVAAPGPSSLGFREPYTEPGVRLPPILPSPTFAAHHTSTHSHRRSDSYPNIFAYQTLSSPQQQQQQQHQQHETPSSSSSSQRFARPQESPRSMFELRSPYPVAGTHETSPPHQIHHQTQRPHSTIIPTTTHTTTSPVYSERRRESTANDDDENPQPSKRRRMAVDDIVNV